LIHRKERKMRGLRLEWRAILTLAALFGVLALAGCSSDPEEGGGPSRLPQGGDSEPDLVITNGRVMDPLSGTDTVATLAVRGGTIERITTDPDEGSSLANRAARVIDASGRVVSPGFINTHTHEGIILESMKVFVKDGITTWVGGNCGSSAIPLADYYEEIEADGMYNNYASLTGLNSLRDRVDVDTFDAASEAQIAEMVALLADDMEAGSMGVSFGAYYNPGCTYEEMLATAQEAARHGGMASSHIRDNIFNLRALIPFWDYYLNKQCLSEAIQTAREADIPYLISHLTDVTYGPGSTAYALEMISGVLYQEGLRLAVDVIGANSFPNDFFTIARYGTVPLDLLMAMADAVPSDFQVTEDVVIDGQVYMEAFETMAGIEQAETIMEAILAERATSPGVLCHIIDPENTMLALSKPYVFVGNDGSIRMDPDTGELVGHPRAVGSFARFIGHWARDMGVMNLTDALFKATAGPAVWFGLDKKGRLQEGCDADIVVFDPERIIDRAEASEGNMLKPPDGIDYVIVNGVVTVEGTELTGERPGRAIRRTWEVPGVHHGM
jgi:N-acyl-D-amino-acid deacylase